MSVKIKMMEKQRKNKKVFLFVDGSNLYAGQYDLFGPKKYLDFSKFIEQVEQKIKTHFDQIYFYASYSSRPKRLTKKIKQYIINEFQFYKKVKELDKVIFFKGYRSKTSGKEKEVDVKLTADLIGFGLLDKYSAAYLLTGDADFLQAVFFVKKYKKTRKIKLLCLSNKIMYKGLYYLPSAVIEFKKGVAKSKKIARKAKVIYIKKTAELCPRLD